MISETSEGVWWCNHHGRPATHINYQGEHCCDPKLSGNLLPCNAFLAPIQIDYIDELGFPTELSYKGELTKAMTELARDPLVHFVGYGLKTGRALGTLKDVAEGQLMLGEMPVAEDLMVRVAIGMSFKGLKPVVFLERFDFIHNAMDAIVNHLDKFAEISSGEFQPKIILRIVVGNSRKPLFTGPTHTQDYSVMLRAAVSFPVVQLIDASQILPEYRLAYGRSTSTALIEYKDLI